MSFSYVVDEDMDANSGMDSMGQPTMAEVFKQETSRRNTKVQNQN